MNIEKIARAIERDAGMELPDVRQALALVIHKTAHQYPNSQKNPSAFNDGLKQGKKE